MKNDELTLRDKKFLSALAGFLLDLGADRAADAIYSLIAADESAPPTDEWAEAFAG